MEETRKLFYEDSHQKEFDAVVLSCESVRDGYEVVLNQTVFFPEGGGQYGDKGCLGEVRVLDTTEKMGVVYHKTDEPLEEGTAVHGVIDWEERFSKMQQHTGEHIVSGIVHRRFGYNNVGFHLGSDYCTMDFDGAISSEQLMEIEEEANRAVFANLELRTIYPEQEMLKELEYRSKIEIEGQVRLIEIPGVDLCACCAPHVSRTGEIGLIKLVAMEHYKGGERIHMLSGDRALLDYQAKQENAKRIGQLLCEKENQIADAVERLKETEDSMKLQIVRLRKELLHYKAREIDVSEALTIVFDEELSGNDLRELMNCLLERGAEICAVFAGTDRDGYRYVIGSKKQDVRALNQKLKDSFEARGGGKPEMVQGSLQAARERIKKVLERV